MSRNIRYKCPFCEEKFTREDLVNHIEDEHKITLIDGDIIESKNLKNQKFSYFDVSQPKSKVLCERYQTIYTRSISTGRNSLR